jgi:hypothetical protein
MLTIGPLYVESQIMALDSQINMWCVKSEQNNPFLTIWSLTDMKKVNLYKFVSTPKDHTDIKNMNVILISYEDHWLLYMFMANKY